MKITKITSQNRRDIYGILQCEGCGITEKFYGYDDHNFHNNVIPHRPCNFCGKSAIQLDVPLEPMEPKYPPDALI